MTPITPAMTPARSASPLTVWIAAATSGRRLIATSASPRYGTAATNVPPSAVPRTNRLPASAARAASRTRPAAADSASAGPTIRSRTLRLFATRASFAGVTVWAIWASLRATRSPFRRNACSELSENCATTIAVDVAATTANATPSHQRTPINSLGTAQS